MAGMSGGGLGLMALNDTKAGMEGLDKESISKVNESNFESLVRCTGETLQGCTFLPR